MDLELRKQIRQQRKAVLAKKAWSALFATLAATVVAYVLVEVLEIDERTGTGVAGRIFCVIPVWISLGAFVHNLNRYKQERLEEDEENKGPLIQTLNLDGRQPTEEREYDELKPL